MRMWYDIQRRFQDQVRYCVTGDVTRALPLAERMRDLRATRRVDKAYQSM